MTRSTRRLLLLAGAAAAVALAVIATHRSDEALVTDEDRPPEGRWRRLPGGNSAHEDERARLLSLPYSSAGRVPATRGGVVRFDRTRTAPGLDLYASGHAPEAFLITPEGRVERRWSISFRDAFPDAALPSTADSGLAYFRRIALGPGGDLFALFQGGGVVRLDRHSRPVMSYAGPTFNDLWVGPRGELLVPVKYPTRLPEIAGEREVLEDAIVELSPEGQLRRRVSIPRAFLASDFSRLLEPLPDGPDILHTNTIEPLDGRCASGLPAFAAGNWLISLREIDTVAVLDPTRERIVWAQRGPWDGQHDPSLLGNCHLLVFDNKGAPRGSRVLELDPASGAVVWSYSGPRERPLDSREGGAAHRLQNGNTLIVESDGGRAIELAPDGTVVWEFLTPHRAGRAHELVATLWDVLRVENDAPIAAR